MSPFVVLDPLMSRRPPGWQVHGLRRISRLVEKQNTTGKSPLLSLTIQGRLENRGAEVQPPSDEYLLKYGLVEPGDLVVNPMWLSGGSIGVSRTSGAVSPEYRIYRFSGTVHPPFVHHLVRSEPYMHQYRLLVRAETTFDRRVTKEDFRELPILLPPIAVQSQIAAYLDAETARIDALIEKKQRLSQLIRDRFEAHRRWVILQGLNPVDGSGQLPDGWMTAALGVALELHRGFDLPAESRVEGEVPVVSSGGISGYHDRKGCDGPGVVTGRYGTVGEVYYVAGPYWPLNTTLFVSDFRGKPPRWVYHLLAAVPLNIDEAKSAVTGINRNVVGQLRVPIPPRQDQEAIAGQLDHSLALVERVIELLQTQVAYLREHRQALITAAVTGEIPTPGVAA